MIVGISPESGRPNMASVPVAGNNTRSALLRLGSVRPWKKPGEAIHQMTIITTPSARAPMPTTATAPKPKIVTLLPPSSTSQSGLAYWIRP